MNSEEHITCWHVGESGGCDDCKLGLETMSCNEEFASWYAQCEG